jgi:hypothetical protein
MRGSTSDTASAVADVRITEPFDVAPNLAPFLAADVKELTEDLLDVQDVDDDGIDDAKRLVGEAWRRGAEAALVEAAAWLVQVGLLVYEDDPGPSGSGG